MARQVTGCVTAGEGDSWGGAHAKTTLLVAQLGAGVTTGLHLAGAGLGAAHCLVAWVIWVAQPVALGDSFHSFHHFAEPNVMVSCASAWGVIGRLPGSASIGAL